MNITITTNPTGRSPESKFYFGKGTEDLDLSRPKYNKIGDNKDYWSLFCECVTFKRFFNIEHSASMSMNESCK